MSEIPPLFQDGSKLESCADAADIDDNGEVQLSDAIGLLNILFRGGRAPQDLGSDCGFDPIGLSCVASCP